MSTSMPFIWLLIGCALVTVIPRILPFIFVRRFKLPNVVMKWLSYIPVCILTALVVENMIIQTEQALQIDWTILLALIPTLLIAIWTKSLAITVVIGVVTMALIRWVI